MMSRFAPGLVYKETMGTIPFEPNELTHVDGALGMARSQSLDSAESQFYICDGPQHGLDGDYIVFGVLLEGFDVVAAMSQVQTTTVGNLQGVPVEDIVVEAAYCE